MIPLGLADRNEAYIIRRISGSDEIKKHLGDLGFIVGGTVSVVTETAGNLIVNVKDARVAIDRALARKIMV